MTPEQINKLGSELGNNVLLIVSDAEGASGFFKVRGLTAYEIGKLYGAALVAIHTNLDGLLSQADVQDPVRGRSMVLDGIEAVKSVANNGRLYVADRRQNPSDSQENA